MKMIPSRIAVVNVARAHTWVREEGENRGEAVQAILRRVGLDEGWPYCAAFVAYCGYAVLRDKWPLPKDARCQALAEFAQSRDLLRREPLPGSVFLIWSNQLNRFRHTGFLIQTHGDPPSSWLTIEANTNPQNSAEGDGVYERVRVFDEKDRFIPWAELL